ncbi:MAG TPA: FixH family protein [Syntrophorhabdaceae bacterium]
MMLLLGVWICIPSAFARDFVVRRNVGGYTLDIAIDRNPPILGLNKVKIGVKDTQGKALTDIPVTVNYYMPPMPGMPPMNYTVKALPRGAEYTMTMDLIMTGPWNIVIKATVQGKLLRVTVPIDVR